MSINKTLQYYNQNASSFVDDTVSVDFQYTHEKFIKYIKPEGLILDCGCGSGRDIRYFVERGYQVEAIDGSEELCRIASEYSGIQVKHTYFQELSEHGKYDGIWACSSILHLTYTELQQVLVKISVALKTKGRLYTSFKYGEFDGERNGRYFTDMTEERLNDLLEKIGGFQILEFWITPDVRPGREEEKWLNVIMQKK
jgi:SAM-dependent methyltransferase